MFLTNRDLVSRFIGFDKLFWDMEKFLSTKTSSYPFFDIVKTPNGRRIEIAVAGFSKEDVDVNLNKATQTLTITANTVKEEKEKLFSSIATRSFSKSFVLEPSMEVGEIEMKNGILSIDLIEKELKLENEQILKLTVK